MLQFLNIFFFVFHTALTLFNLFGWVWKRTRQVNLLAIVLTFGSWFGLGVWHGWGYCPCTDWHWEIRSRLGYADTANSYIEFMVEKLTGLQVAPAFIDPVTVGGLIVAFLVSLGLNIKDWRRKT